MNLLFYLQLSLLQRRMTSLTFGILFLFFCYHIRFIHAFEALHQAEKNTQATQKIFYTQHQLIQKTAQIAIKIKTLQAMQPQKSASDIVLDSAQKNHITDTQLSSDTKNTLILHYSANWNDITHFLQTLAQMPSPLALEKISLQPHDDSDILFVEMHMRLTPVATEDIAKTTENIQTHVKEKNPFHHAIVSETNDTEPQSPEHFLWRGYLMLHHEVIAFYQNSDGLMTKVKPGDVIAPGDWSVVSVQPGKVVLKNTHGKMLNISLRV